MDAPLAEAYEHRDLPRDAWLAQTADAIEKLGNINETNFGYIVAKEQPHEGKLRIIVVPRSVDWALHETLRGAFDELDQHAPAVTAAALKQQLDRLLRSVLIRDAKRLARGFIDAHIATAPGSLASDGLTRDDLAITDELLSSAEAATPVPLSPVQLFLDGHLDRVLPPDAPALRAYEALPAEKKAAIRHLVIAVLKLEGAYRNTSSPALPT